MFHQNSLCKHILSWFSFSVKVTLMSIWLEGSLFSPLPPGDLDSHPRHTPPTQTDNLLRPTPPEYGPPSQAPLSAHPHWEPRTRAQQRLPVRTAWRSLLFRAWTDCPSLPLFCSIQVHSIQHFRAAVQAILNSSAWRNCRLSMHKPLSLLIFQKWKRQSLTEIISNLQCSFATLFAGNFSRVHTVVTLRTDETTLSATSPLCIRLVTKC